MHMCRRSPSLSATTSPSGRRWLQRWGTLGKPWAGCLLRQGLPPLSLALKILEGTSHVGGKGIHSNRHLYGAFICSYYIDILSVYDSYYVDILCVWLIRGSSVPARNGVKTLPTLESCTMPSIRVLYVVLCCRVRMSNSKLFPTKCNVPICYISLSVWSCTLPSPSGVPWCAKGALILVGTHCFTRWPPRSRWERGEPW